ncbi:hypothetical protein [Colwellia sp. UCD-KL20]|uniref:DUF6414 family protein n=1 Tax=Colwellia sp. UCD-KL20 TaxID=1917165 RepID=UPI0009708B36|nr:hypothetical protein [Colwellia sp. UCD-KL20]
MDKLLVPVYLNQKLVFDLLAMLQGGLSTVTAITKTSSTTSGEKDNVSVGFGLSEAFSTLLKIDLSGTKNKESNSSNSNLIAEERVHTPASLFYQLRNLMINKNILNQLTTEVDPKPGDFIEFEGSLQRNPVVETIDSLIEMLKMAEVFETSSIQNNGKNKNQPPKYKPFREKLSEFSNNIQSGNTSDLTSNSRKTSHKAVITLETAYLNDPMMADLVDGQFKVIGKVIRSVDNSSSINLLRNTALSKMPPDKLEQLFSSLSKLGTEQGFGIPSLSPEISGPAIQIIPIAIYA